MNSPFLSTMARHFLAVAEARSITDASLALHVAPSAVSRQVALMEAAMGCALFQRQARGMALTEAGETPAGLADGGATRIGRGAAPGAGPGPAAAQRLHLACTEGFTTAFMPQLMGRFRAQWPGARLFLRVGDAQQVDQWLQRGEVEVGLRFATRPVEGLRVVASVPSPIVAVCEPRHPLAGRPTLSVSDLVAQPLALPEGSSTVRQVLDSACALAGTHYEVACSGNLPTLIALVEQGGLVMLGSRMSVMHALERGSLVALPVADASFMQRRVQLLVREGRLPGEVAGRFLEQAAAALSASETVPGSGSDPAEHQVPDAVAELEAAVLEFGQRAVVGLGGVAIAALGRRVGQQRFRAQHLQHLLGVGFPVGGQMQVATSLEVARQAVHKRRLDQAAFVVAALVPGVGEEDVHAVQALFGQQVVQHFDRVVAEDADVLDALFAAQLEQRTDARLVHLAAQEVVARPHLGDVGRGATHAEADFRTSGALRPKAAVVSSGWLAS